MRIVAGTLKGRRLEGPKGQAARPTADRVREALFSILGDIEGLAVLDLFAGTGALTIEAISRGAERAVLVERDRKMYAVAGRNLASTGAEERARLVQSDALKYLSATPEGKFDLVLLDPPYAEAVELCMQIAELFPGWLAEGARVVVECERRNPVTLPVERFAERSQHRYGDTLLRIFDAL